MIPQLALRTQTVVTPQMVLASHLLELPVSELEIVLQREVANNPALELDVADEPTWPHETLAPLKSWKDSDGSSSEDFRGEADSRAWHASAREQLVAQARLLVTAEDLAIATHIIHSLDAHGFLREANETLASELDVTAAQIERVVCVLHELEPPGIGARDIRECFLLQCAALAAEGVNCDLVCRILYEAWDDFLAQRWPRVAAALGVHPSAMEAARRFMCRNLYPYPLLLVDEPTTDTAIFRHADVIVRPNPDKATAAQCQYVIDVPAAERYHLSIRRDFQQMLAMNPGSGTGLPIEHQVWLGQSIAHAQSIISAVNQRWATLRRIAAYVVDQQADFFTFGPGHLKPLPRVAVAQALDMHESTVSRAVRDKIMQHPNGRLFAMSDLFDGSRSVKEALRCVIEQADSPLSDRELALRLQAQGWTLARRTVAKYREQLGIQPRNRPQTIRTR
jgi:RNA polymerase sigma-54 factor